MCMKNSKPRIAIIGHRGIPSSYGGFETLADELSQRIVQRGFETIVYCRSNYFKEKPKEFHGAKLIYLPTIAWKFLDTPVHSVLTTLHLLIKNTADTVIVVNVGNALFAWILKLFGKKVFLNVD